MRIHLFFALITAFSFLACGGKNSATLQPNNPTATPTVEKVAVTFNADSAYASVQNNATSDLVHPNRQHTNSAATIL